MLLGLIERSLVYFGSVARARRLATSLAAPQNYWFRAADETKLHGWYFPHAEPKRLVVYRHGDSERWPFQLIWCSAGNLIRRQRRRYRLPRLWS